MDVLCIDRRWVEDYIRVKLSGISAEIILLATNFVAQLAHCRSVTMPLRFSCQQILFWRVGQPYSIVKIINDLFLQYLAYEPFKNRRSNRSGFAMDKDEVKTVKPEK